MHEKTISIIFLEQNNDTLKGAARRPLPFSLEEHYETLQQTFGFGPDPGPEPGLVGSASAAGGNDGGGLPGL